MFSYLKRIRTTGTVISTSVATVQKMLSYIDFEHSNTIIELGAGKGVVTQPLVQRANPETNLYIFELLPVFAEKLKHHYQSYKNVNVIQDSAEKIPQYLPKTAIDACISVLPLSIMDKKVVHNIFNTIATQLTEKGVFIQLQYTKRLENVFKDYFHVEKRDYSLWNFPPAYLYILRKKSTLS